MMRIAPTLAHAPGDVASRLDTTGGGLGGEPASISIGCGGFAGEVSGIGVQFGMGALGQIARVMHPMMLHSSTIRCRG